MSDAWERIFTKPTAPEETSAPRLDENSAPLFRMQTETRTDYLNQIKKEGRERIESDILLREEMHTFGMIPCGFFDPESKIVTISPTLRESVSVATKTLVNTSGNAGYFTFVDSTEACLFEPGRDIVLHVVHATEEEIIATGIYLDENEPYSINLVVSRGAADSGTGTTAIATIQLCGAIYKNAAKFPDIANATTKKFDINSVNFFK